MQDRPQLSSRKARGAFFTPSPIADYLAAWAVGDDPTTKVLDPSCGEAAFLLAASRRLRKLGCPPDELDGQVFGVDLDPGSLAESLRRLRAEDLDAHLIEEDFFDVVTPHQLGAPIPEVDAVIGNPPFVRYQQHRQEARRRAARTALAQGVQLSGLASSWAPLLVHASAFLKPEGRLAMVLPLELLTVHYAEPVRKWLRRRFAAVHLVMFERLQFEDALEKVLLLVAQGSGGCDAFSLYTVEDASDLQGLRPFDHLNVTPAREGKWTDVFLSAAQRGLFREVSDREFLPLSEYGTVELGTVTGANDYFVLTEETRTRFGLAHSQVSRVCPPGTRHLKGLAFTDPDWRRQRDGGEGVWLFHPAPEDDTPELIRYVMEGSRRGVDKAYKCRIRSPWWRPPMVTPPDMFFTYMSHRFPRLIENRAGTTFVNSMHGVRLKDGTSPVASKALPLLCLNTVTMLGAEIHGRSYGGGILKMEPREASQLPMPSRQVLLQAWDRLQGRVRHLDALLRAGQWEAVVAEVDDVLLHHCIGLGPSEIAELGFGVVALRERRLGAP